MSLRFKQLLHKLGNWEFWPMWAIYFPLLPLWLWYLVRTCNPFLFRYVNPGIPNGGLYGVSKREIYDRLPRHLIPVTVRVEHQASVADVVREGNFSYPLIVKPDNGCRGVNVKKIETFPELLHYAATSSAPFLIQEYVAYPMEAGVFYALDPKTGVGRITGITLKEFMTLTGDGIRSVGELLLSNKRYNLQFQRLSKEIDLDYLPKVGETLRLGYIGNHNLGTLFLDASHWLTLELEQAFDEIARQTSGFCYGRFDIRFASRESLCRGEAFTIIELNGALSEPTHMYDPKYTYFQGIRELYRHHKMMLEIARLNARKSENQLAAVPDSGK